MGHWNVERKSYGGPVSWTCDSKSLFADPAEGPSLSPTHTQWFSHKTTLTMTVVTTQIIVSKGILTWRGRGSCSPKRVINKARRLIEYTALHAAVCGRLWLQLRLYVRRIIFVRVGLCACRRPRTQPTNKKDERSVCSVLS